MGTGWYLDRCRFPVPQPRIGLIDLNPSALAKTSSRLSRFAPEPHRADLLEPVPALTDPFDSLAMCYLLHCLPVDPEHECQVVPNLRALLNPGAVVFGATILGDEGPHSALGRAMLAGHNATRVFSNRGDTVETLEAGLAEHLGDLDIELVGAVAMFRGVLNTADRGS